MAEQSISWKTILMRPVVIACIVITTLSYLNMKVYSNLSIVKKEQLRNRMTYFLNIALVLCCMYLVYHNVNSKKELGVTELIAMFK